ncbi:MAG: tocopherol cyclase family protein [bacterium]|nr:tocopherol cyclase family protein [bacterium]
MKQLFLKKNPELFQGQKYLETNKSYFEGWYFKQTNAKVGISFIPGIHINQKEKKAFIQVITNDASYFVDYPIEKFEFGSDPFYVKIDDNFFSQHSLHIDIRDEHQKLVIYGDIIYDHAVNISTSFLRPNIMGPFSYIPFMECNHAILCMKNRVNGVLEINHKRIGFNQGVGYIEKDWGYSFPKSYIWCQGNHFSCSDASFMMSIADIPFLLFHFRGIICVLIVDDQEYRFTTYHGVQLKKYEVSEQGLDIILKKGRYSMEVKTDYQYSFELMAPVKGEMVKNIFESISSSITITLRKGKRIVFSDTSVNAGVEVVS